MIANCECALGGCAIPHSVKALRLIRHEALEAGADVRLGDVNIVLFGDSGRAVPHQFGERMSVHSALGTPGSECVAPAVKRERVQPGSVDRSPVGFLDADQVP